MMKNHARCNPQRLQAPAQVIPESHHVRIRIAPRVARNIHNWFIVLLETDIRVYLGLLNVRCGRIGSCPATVKSTFSNMLPMGVLQKLPKGWFFPTWRSFFSMDGSIPPCFLLPAYAA